MSGYNPIERVGCELISFLSAESRELRTIAGRGFRYVRGYYPRCRKSRSSMFLTDFLCCRFYVFVLKFSFSHGFYVLPFLYVFVRKFNFSYGFYVLHFLRFCAEVQCFSRI